MDPQLADLAAYSTLFEIESFVTYACEYTMTATPFVFINGQGFEGDVETYTFLQPSQTLIVTFNYPSVTMSTLSAGETLLFVEKPTRRR